MRINKAGHELAERGTEAGTPGVSSGILVSEVGKPKFLRLALLVY